MYDDYYPKYRSCVVHVFFSIYIYIFFFSFRNYLCFIHVLCVNKVSYKVDIWKKNNELTDLSIFFPSTKRRFVVIATLLLSATQYTRWRSLKSSARYYNRTKPKCLFYSLRPGGYIKVLTYTLRTSHPGCDSGGVEGSMPLNYCTRKNPATASSYNPGIIYVLIFTPPAVPSSNIYKSARFYCHSKNVTPPPTDPFGGVDFAEEFVTRDLTHYSAESTDFFAILLHYRWSRSKWHLTFE